MNVNEVSGEVVDAAIEVHRALGPGLLESAYVACLSREFALRGIAFERQKPLRLEYKNSTVDCGYRLDLVVEDRVVVEVKALGLLLPIHDAQLLTYMKLGGWKVGLLLNFNVRVLKDGVRRLVLGLEEER